MAIERRQPRTCFVEAPLYTDIDYERPVNIYVLIMNFTALQTYNFNLLTNTLMDRQT